MGLENKYLSYTEYLELNGTLDEVPFNILEFKARKTIDEYTFNRLVNLDEQVDEVKMCMLELIGILNQEEKNINSEQVKSENIDGYSVNYSVKEKSKDDYSKEKYDCVRSYLINCRLADGTPYMYLGVC